MRHQKYFILSAVLVVLITGCAGQTPIGSEEDARPKNAAEAYANLGRQYLLQGSLDLAEARLHKAIQLEPDFAKAHHDLAVVYGELRNTGAAEAEYQIALRLAPGDITASYNYATLLYNQGKYAEAAEKFQTVVVGPSSEQKAVAYEALGLIALRNGDPAQAEKRFEEALAITPTLPRALLESARVAFQSDRFLLAKNYLQRHLEATRGTPAGFLFGVHLGKALNDEKLVTYCQEQLRKKFPESPEVRQLNQPLEDVKK